MNEYVFSFDRPWLFLVAVPVLAFIFFLFFRTPRNKRRRVGRYIALIARSLTVLLAVTMFAGLHVTEVKTTPPDKTNMIVVVDLSDSTYTLKEDMDAYIREMIEEAKKTGKDYAMGILSFANGVITEVPLSDDLDGAYNTYVTDAGAPVGNATDLEDAIYRARDMLPIGDYIHRIVLLSDGRQTTGNAYNAAKNLSTAERSVRLDAVSFNVTDSAYQEVAISSVTVTRQVKLGETISIRVRVRSTLETFCKLQVFDGNSLILESPEALEPGVKTFQFTYTPTEKGIHQLRVALASPDASQNQQFNDSLTQNNSLSNWFRVIGKYSVLIVDNTGVGASRIEQAVGEAYDLYTIPTSQFPATMEELLPYDEVVLCDLYYQELPQGADTMLVQYVSKIGRGLFITGGKETELLKSYVGTPLEDVLPVTMTLDETEYNVAVLVVLDISGSMVSASVDRLQTAKDAAKVYLSPEKGIMGEHDLFGVVTFGYDAARHLEMTPVSNRDYICDRIDEIKVHPMGGTNYGDALRHAYYMMRDCQADSKQVIFISDGEPFDSAPYKELPTYFAQAGITLSTVYIGEDAGNNNSTAQQILIGMADKGQGNFYPVKNSEGLDDVLFELTDNVKRAMFINEGEIELVDGGTGSAALNGVTLNDVALMGYLGSTLILDPNISMAIYANDHRPVYAEKELGLGHVGLFLTELSGDWCASLNKTDSGNLLLRNMIQCSLNQEVNSTGMDVKATYDHTGTDLLVKPSLDLEGQEIRLHVTKFTGEEVTTITLSRIGASGYYGTFDTEDPNDLYILELLLVDKNGMVQDKTTLAFSGGYIQEYDIFSDNGIDLLKGVSKVTGGKVMEDPEDIFKVDPPKLMEYEVSLLDYFCLIVAALIFIDILARHLIFTKQKKPPTET